MPSVCVFSVISLLILFPCYKTLNIPSPQIANTHKLKSNIMADTIYSPQLVLENELMQQSRAEFKMFSEDKQTSADYFLQSKPLHLFLHNPNVKEIHLPAPNLITESKDSKFNGYNNTLKLVSSDTRPKDGWYVGTKTDIKRNSLKDKLKDTLIYWQALPVPRIQTTEGLQRNTRAVTAKKERIWDYGVIPYEIDPVFSDINKALFRKAMRHWESHTCIKFVEREPGVHINYIYFTIKSCGCCSFVGKRGNGPQDISIGRNCEKFGIVVHELGHVIGFWHEHTRIDRDKHIIINRANIIKGQEYNFNVLTPDEIDSLGLPYDYTSIMHYAKNTFSKSLFLDTILPIGLASGERIEIGQRLRLSPGDIIQANLLYNCPKCGQTYQTNAGEIISPHFFLFDDNETMTNTNDKSPERCEWRITAFGGQTIRLQILEMNLLETMDCKKDYLEIRDGYWLNSPVIKRICGNTTLEDIQTNSNRMLLNYVNHNFMHGFKGIYAKFEVFCGGEIELNREYRLDSPNYPADYASDEKCVWQITAPENHQVAVKFLSFEIESHDDCIYDYVELRDGNKSDSEVIGVFCGYKVPPYIRSNSNQMYVKFVSDNTVQKSGFSATFMAELDECKYIDHGCQHECINTVGSYRCTCFAGFQLKEDGKTCGDACGGRINATSANGTLTSPQFPDPYPNSKECVWEISAPTNHSVFLTFTHFELEGTKYRYSECNYDYVIIYSKMKDNRLKKIGTFCGKDLPPVISSEQNVIRIEFYADKSIQHTGFSVSYYVDKNECAANTSGCQHYCKNTFGSYKCSCRTGFTLNEDGHHCTETECKFELTNSYGVVNSPNYPAEYPRNTYCYWHFSTALGHRIQITFHDFDLENHQECIYDSVSVHDGNSDNGSMLAHYCGKKEPNTVLASANEMFMVLKTDAGLQKKGFMATYSTECGGYIRATRTPQVFYSHPKFGTRPYKRKMYCNWRIQADSDSSVKIAFLNFELEYSERCDYDWIQIYEEQSYMVVNNHGRYCGRKKPPPITSYSDTILIRFKTDESTSLRGFAVSFVAVDPPDEESGDTAVTPFPGYMKSIYHSAEMNEDYQDAMNT